MYTAYDIVTLCEWSLWSGSTLAEGTVRPPRPLIESDDTICCIHTILPPEDEHNTARNM